jgi:hypothetical protein
MAEIITDTLGIFKDNNWYKIDTYSKSQIDQKISDSNKNTGFIAFGSAMFDGKNMYQVADYFNPIYGKGIVISRMDDNCFLVRVYFNTSVINTITRYNNALMATPQLFNWDISQNNYISCSVRYGETNTDNIAWRVYVYSNFSGIITDKCGISVLVPCLEY